MTVADVQTVEQRLSATIGDLVVINAKLGYEVAVLRNIIADERARAAEAEARLKEMMTPPSNQGPSAAAG